MKKLENRYSYEVIYEDFDDLRVIKKHNSPLKVWKNNRFYQTKMDVNDLPEHYCDVQRYGCNHDVLSAKGIKDLYYTWVRENHFMKDSMLRVSYTGEISSKPMTIMVNGEEKESFFKDYLNVDEIVFGTDILKFLAYVKKYSDFDITPIKHEFINQCEWLKEHEPAYAPDAEDFGEWFDNKINEYICQ